MIASQLDADKILIGGLNLWQSNDAGATYEGVGGYIGGISNFHVDQQEYRIYKTSETTEEIWFSNDGGIGHSSDFMQSHDNLNRGLKAVNLWGYDQGWNEDMMVGGRYHNGNMGYHENYPEGEFLALGGGEAATGYVKYTDENRTMFSDIGGKILPETLADPVQGFGLGLSPNEAYWNNGSSRVMFDHEYFNVAWLGREHKLYRSTNGGGSFSEFFAFGSNVSNGIYWMEQSYANPNHLYVQQGIGNTGKIWHSSDHGITWEEMDLPQNLRYFSFSLSGTNPLEMWISYYDGNNANKVFRTQDAGANWENLTTSTLNGLYPWAIAHQYGTDGGVYLAMQHGVVFYRNNSMSDWMSYSTGLPVGTEPLRIVPFVRDNVVRLATWNLGVWEAPAYESSELIADFSAAYETFFCPGDEVHFVNHSVCSANATFEWSFPGATPATSTEPYPTVVYNEAGTFDVTLTVTDDGQSQTVTYTNYISNTEATGGDFYEDFESAGIPQSWIVEENAAWTISDAASAFATGTYSMRYDNYYNDAQGARHRVWLGKRSGANLGVSFDVAYAQYSDGYSDTLAVVYSIDCGETWTELWSMGGDDLSTAPDNTGYYVPASTEWASYSANLPAGIFFEDVILAFENRGYYGNVIYVDNINVFTNVSVEEAQGSAPVMDVFPNPATTQLRISASSLQLGNYRIQLFDLTGKLVSETSVFAAGSRLERNVELTDLANGQYIVALVGEREIVRKSFSIVR
jgi:PKD repeat protein